MWILIGTVFVASLLGSLHCVGMCGPFALLASADPEQRSSAVGPTVAYSLGRLITYVSVGLLFGLLGMAINQGPSFSSFQQSATLIAGLLMILIGGIALARHLGMRITLPGPARHLQRLLGGLFRSATNLPPLWRALSIGMLTSLMPCGWLYTFAIAAAGTGSPVWGAATMAAFWLGTVPIMVSLMLGASRVSAGLLKRLPLAMATIVILIGLFTVTGRATVMVGQDLEVVQNVDQIQFRIQQVDQSKLPCCENE